jgi:hypothetical protein
MMIDRRKLRISGLLLMAMVAATLWRLSLFSDWRHIPLGNPADHHTITGLVFFAAPASLLIAMVMTFLTTLLISNVPEESMPAWSRWNGRWLVTLGALMALVQAVTLIRSFGILPLSAQTVARGVVVFIGIIFMVIGNATPKLPSLTALSGPFRLGPWQENRLLRFVGKLLFGLGLFLATSGILLPPALWSSAFLCLALAAFAAAIWYRIKLRREPSPLP